jgi:hypothetical protein
MDATDPIVASTLPILFSENIHFSMAEATKPGMETVKMP